MRIGGSGFTAGNRDQVLVDGLAALTVDFGKCVGHLPQIAEENTSAFPLLLDTLPPLTVYETEYTEEDDIKPDVTPTVTVTKEDGVWNVEGQWLYKLMGRINFDDRESMAYFDKMLRKYGIFDQMEAQGVCDGDLVSLYGFEYEYVK